MVKVPTHFVHLQLNTGKSLESYSKNFVSVGAKIKRLKSVLAEDVLKRSKFTKEELEQAEEAWIRG